MIPKRFYALLFVLASLFSLNAQERELTSKDSTIVNSWMIGVGYNIVNDSGNRFDGAFDISDSWNSLVYPNRISVGKYFNSGLGIEVAGAFMKLKEGKIVERKPLTEDMDIMTLDLRLSYDLNKVIGETGWFDPYIGVGVGFTDGDDVLSRNTANGVLGFRTWFSDNFGLDFNTAGKWSIDGGNTTDYVQHSVGVVFRLGYEKELSKKGKEQLALNQAIEEERIRKQDSINEVKRKEEELLRQKLAAEAAAEEARKAKLEEDKKIAKENEVKEIQNALDLLDTIYFGFDSESLNGSTKESLSGLAAILSKYPDLVIEIASHTDARGSSEYNLKLSERRLKSSLDYIFSLGVNESQIVGKAKGETQLINSCDDITKCSSQQHKENRRLGIQILSN
ncbi:OmpA family protein [Seonamhaeicola sp. MEBiC1930]|uniref:OmpA family protein n=1 Tax=Seonamhaeicola sp. MEBiC01930 TaxID=2976768 RepID=UPI00324866DD